MKSEDFQKQLDLLQIKKVLAELPDDVTLDSQKASIYLDMSEDRLGELRQKGGGPVFRTQEPTGTKGRNVKAKYDLGDLRKWKDTIKVGSVLENAARQGLCWMTVNDLFQETPWWVQANKIVSPYSTMSVEKFKDNWLDEEITIHVGSFADVLLMNWLDVNLKVKAVEFYKGLTNDLMDAVRASIDHQILKD